MPDYFATGNYHMAAVLLSLELSPQVWLDYNFLKVIPLNVCVGYIGKDSNAVLVEAWISKKNNSQGVIFILSCAPWKKYSANKINLHTVSHYSDL